MSESIRYDDRIDVDTDLSLIQTFAMIGRSLGLLTKVKKLFAYKVVFATVALLPKVFFRIPLPSGVANKSKPIKYS